MSAQSAPAPAQETVREEEALTPTLSQREREQGEELEQKETEGTKEETLTPALSQREREQDGGTPSPGSLREPPFPSGRGALERNAAEGVPYSRLAERLRQSERLPAGLRMRLAELIEAQESPESVEAAIRAVEEALPGGLRIDQRYLRRPEHPSGEQFFEREPGELSDDEAERIAREQLAWAGLLRGQRVRVGD
jgi:hypothetical protein